MDILEKKHPSVWKVVNDRAFRLVILLLVLTTLVGDLRQNLKSLESPATPPSFQQIPDYRDARIVMLETQVQVRTNEAEQHLVFKQKLNESAFQIVATTNRPRAVNLTMRCDGDFRRYSLEIAREEGEILSLGPNVMHGTREAELIALSPSWDQMHPLIVNIFGASARLKKCDLKLPQKGVSQEVSNGS